MIKAKRIYPLIILSIVFLFNPNINIIDLLPDVVAYATLVLIIGNHAQTVPYLAECKEALMKLVLVTLVKIPAFVIMYSNMRLGSDIVPLFTLSFAVLEYIFIFAAVKNLFLAFSYIGERTDCASVREPFSISKRKTSTPEALEKFTLIFFLVKAIINVLPELFLLTGEDFALKRRLMNVYPTVLVISVLASLLICIIWLSYALKYVKALRKGGDIPRAFKEMESYTGAGISNVDRVKKRYLDALNLLELSSIFIFDLSFKNSGGRSILPHFIYGLVLFSSVINLAENKKIRVLLCSFTAGFSISAVINQVLNARFFDRYQYADIGYSRLAREEYASIKISAVFETLFVLGITVLAAIILVRFIKAHTDTPASDPSYSESNRRAHRRLIKITLPLMILSGIINVMKCVNVFLKQNTAIIYSAVNPDGIAAPGIPVFSTAITLISVIFVIYSFALASTLKDEVKLKH